MNIKIRNGQNHSNLQFDESGEYDRFYMQMMEALEDETNSQVVIYETLHSSKLFTSIYLKNSLIETSSGNVDPIIETETN